MAKKDLTKDLIKGKITIENYFKEEEDLSKLEDFLIQEIIIDGRKNGYYVFRSGMKVMIKKDKKGKLFMVIEAKCYPVI